MFPVRLGLGARSPAASSASGRDTAAHGQQHSIDAVTPDMASPPPPRKVSVFMGRETLVDRDEVDRIRHSVELEEGALADAALQRQVETSFDGEATDGTAPSPGQDASRHGSGEPLESASPALKRSRGRPRGSGKPPKPASPAAKKPRGRPRRAETPRSKPQARGRRILGRARPAAAPPAPAAAPVGKEWEIERIVDSRIDADSLTHFYLVKWKGFDARHNTWEPKRNLDKCSDAIVTYERSLRARG